MTPEELQDAVQAALQALDEGKTQDARVQAEAILAAAPGDPNASQILAILFLREGRVKDAIPHLREAELAAPDHPPILNLLGVAHKQGGNRAQAREVFIRAKTIDPDFIDVRLNLGQLELDDGRIDEARVEFDAALSIQPDHPTALAGRARVGLLQHDSDAAIRYGEEALKAQPGNILARLTLAVAKLHTKEFEAARTVALEAAGHAAVTPANRALALGFAADAEDRLGRYDQAFVTYTQANHILAELHRDLIDAPPSPYSPQIISKLMDYVRAGGGEPPPPCPGGERAPVFLMGFPRSGTTLLEQILLAHPKVSSLEEQITLADACNDLVLGGGGLDRLAQLSESEAAQYRLGYWARVAELGAMPGADEVLIDKLPLNTVLLPLIAKIFPHAKILFSLRDPRDVVLSCFQQRFGMNQAMYRLLSLESAAGYYDQVMALGMAAREIHPFTLREVRYEEVIEDLEGVARSVIEFLGLEWEPAVLDYREGARARAINTPSAVQVVEPLYTRSSGKWRNYEKHMAPVREMLDPWAERFGYKDSE